MSEYLIEYGLFVVKVVTLVAVFGLVPWLLLRDRRAGQPEGARLEVLDLSDKYRRMAQMLQHAARAPRRRWSWRKLGRTGGEAMPVDPARPRLFVIDFHGDLKATGVGSLREVVTAILFEATPKDEVLVRLENAGGVVSDHGLAAAQLKRIRERDIPLTVAIDKVAASGGYLMACVGDRLLAAPFAVIGSIGVVAGLPNFRRLLDRHGVDFELQTAGEYKRTLTLFGENTDAAREKVKTQLEETHRLFKGFIAEHRPTVAIDRVATGEYWLGSRALELGLVDRIQTSDDYLMEAHQRARLLHVKYTQKQKPMERLIASMEGHLLRLFGRP